MADIANVEKNRFVIEGPTGNDLKIDSNGSSQSRLFDSAGAALIGQKLMASSVPIVFASDQSALPTTISAIPPIPIGATAVNVEAFGSVGTTAGTDTFYTITNGKTLTIQSFFGGAEEKTGGSVCELFYDPNGDLSVLTRIRAIWVNGDSFTVGVQQEFDGNGTRRIVARRRGYTASGREMEVAFSGYEETT